jgi:hypothetical protein
MHGHLSEDPIEIEPSYYTKIYVPLFANWRVVVSRAEGLD